MTALLALQLNAAGYRIDMDQSGLERDIFATISAAPGQQHRARNYMMGMPPETVVS
jgi:hypothetical protein